MKKTKLLDPRQDPLYSAARALVLSAGRPCESLIQRKLRISYSHAMRLMRGLEGDVITAPDTYGHRQLIKQG
ncbi:hypothetical protein LG200_05245 [Methylobacillus caricis]|uniref:DNA translocase FtsK n=1 Tax=Methylobacillus caricis TaxID=1971611 RepID=UPI001CFF569E|nr:DNA translocase FtsK [Methylobacillus caricis]MCB5187410.1 hypothetical protein [Methylobacillus caricis]